MTRAITIICCLIATLFLVPAQGDCSEIPDYESEAEIECCAVVSGLSQSQVTENQPRLSLAPDVVWHPVRIVVRMWKHSVHLPARILNCVFRE